MAATLKDNCDRQTLFFNFPNDYVAQESQTITPSESYTLETVKFYAIWRIADPGTCYVSIQETTTGFPNGNLISDRASFTVTGSKVLKSITFSTKPSLVSGTKYAIVFEAPSGVSGTKELYLYGDSSSGSYYAGGDRVWKDTGYLGSIWHTQTTQELNFYCWGSSLPGQPITPTPTNNDTEVDFSGFVLSWVTGGNTDTYDVYIGPSGSLVEVSTAQIGTTYTTNIDEVPLNQKIYWRVDATGDGTTTEGTVWNFDARPGKVTTTTPADEATGLTLDATTGAWDAPGGITDSYRVLYATLSGFLEEVDVTSELSLALVDGNFPRYGKWYYWRVDAVNDFGTTVGDELWFSTILFKPPLPTGVTFDYQAPPDDGEGTLSGTPTGENNMMTVRRLVAAARNKIFYEA